jgi:hypothetical protein
MTAQQFHDGALALAPTQRAELAHALILSLEDWEPDFAQELDGVIRNRVLEIESGQAQGRPAFAALEEVRAALK